MTRRPVWKAYLLLARVSNLPTVWTNVLAGMALAGVVVGRRAWCIVAIAISLMYIGGMILNDVFDASLDEEQRPSRPIPSGDVPSRDAAIAAGFALAAGLTIVWATMNSSAHLWGLGLVFAIIYYDVHHKQNPFGPVVMGACRGLVYCVAAASIAGDVSATVMIGGVALAAYVYGLTLVAKHLRHEQAERVVPWLLAGISVFDGAIIALWLSPLLGIAACAAALLTRALQRAVPGT